MEALNLRFAKRAQRQLGDILDYIAMENPDAAEKVANHIEELLEKARLFPEMGRQIYSDLPYREVLAYPCRIIYRRIGATLWVASILRMEQLMRRGMLES